jgi:hypothetical protein
MKNIKKICEWTGQEFYVDFKNRNRRFIDKNAMYAWRKNQNREVVKCLKCGDEFERYKNILHPKSGKPTQYCSNECNRTSNEKREKLKKWANSNKNHWFNKKCQSKVKITKFKKYGDENYNNIEKNIQTCLTKYGVPYATYLPQTRSNGKTVSNFQKEVYNKIKIEYPDALLEEYLLDINKSVDIYVPSKKLIIECFGNYWHCNPILYKEDYYHKNIKMTAKEIWQRDNERIKNFENKGYNVKIVWETQII